MDYEKQIEEASKQVDFITRYEGSIFFLIESMIMTPAEERDSYREELEQTRQELAIKERELETLRKELENAKRNG